jgi:hypothetical protein
MKNWKALLGTVIESISGPQPLSFRNVEDWDNLWQVINELKYEENTSIFFSECMTSWEFDRGIIKKNSWYGDRIYSSDLLISMEYDIANSSSRHIYIRRGYARQLQTPVEEKLNINPTFMLAREGRPYIHYFTDDRGNLSNAYPVVRWLELIGIWSSNGMFKPLQS